MNGKQWTPADTATTHRLREAPLTPRSESPFSTLDAVLLQVIEQHEGKPCPTRKTIREWTGMPRHRIWGYLAGMQFRGLIEIECRGSDTPHCPRMRRMRVKGRAWTDWTERAKGGHPSRFACGMTRGEMKG
jgi:hypothetical protein